MVEFEVFPHLDTPSCRRTPRPTRRAGRQALIRRGYAIDDETAITVVDGTVDVVSEGHWRLFAP